MDIRQTVSPVIVILVAIFVATTILVFYWRGSANYGSYYGGKRGIPIRPLAVGQIRHSPK